MDSTLNYSGTGSPPSSNDTENSDRNPSQPEEIDDLVLKVIAPVVILVALGMLALMVKGGELLYSVSTGKKACCRPQVTDDTCEDLPPSYSAIFTVTEAGASFQQVQGPPSYQQVMLEKAHEERVDVDVEVNVSTQRHAARNGTNLGISERDQEVSTPQQGTSSVFVEMGGCRVEQSSSDESCALSVLPANQASCSCRQTDFSTPGATNDVTVSHGASLVRNKRSQSLPLESVLSDSADRLPC